MSHEQQSCPEMSLIYPQPQLAHSGTRNLTPSTGWHRHLIGNISLAELSQSETAPTSHINSAHFCCPDSLASDNSFAALAAEAQHLWGSVSRTCEPLSNFSSICSSASTVASSTTCSFPCLPAASSFGLAPSFDFTSLGKRRHSAFEYPPCSHGVGTDLAASMAPPQLCSLSLGSGYAMDAAGRCQWQERCAAESQELEEYSLGSGYPG
jgi:hypothetical protein